MLRHAFALIIFVAAGIAATTLAPRLAALAEARYAAQVDAVLQAGGYSWAHSAIDGLQVNLSGPSPSAVAKAEALTIVRAISPVLTVTNDISEAPRVTPTIIPPRLEILKGQDRLILSGTIANEAMIADLKSDMSMLTFGASGFDIDWAATEPVLSNITSTLRHVRISVEEAAITIVGLAETQGALSAVEPMVRQLKTLGWTVQTSIEAPPTALQDFRVTASKSEGATNSVTCAASTPAGTAKIKAAAEMHLGFNATCRMGAGAPGDAWADAAETAISAIAGLSTAELTLSGKVLRITALPPSPPSAVIALKDVLSANLPTGYRILIDDQTTKEASVAASPFKLTVDWPGGDTDIAIASAQSGDGLQRAAGSLGAYTRALFPGAKATFEATDGDSPPEDWRRITRVGLTALSKLTRGSLTISLGEISLTGAAAQPEDITPAHNALSAAGDAWRTTSRISYNPNILALAQPVPPTKCADEVAGAVADAPLSFQPASATLTASGIAAVRRIAALLTRCQDARFEIGGHTDAQGSEAGNLALSRSRAEAVLTTLIAANAPPGHLIAKGYGEARPIADNATAVGRALNRRIEFTLIEDAE